jgi:hypothetical protein
MQALVDRLFDRDHALYRRAVREISEAMVSMLSTKEIVDRILVALTETMGVERSMVLLQDEEAAALRPEASRGEWEDEALGGGALAWTTRSAPLWMRREEPSRGDFDDEPDLEHARAVPRRLRPARGGAAGADPVRRRPAGRDRRRATSSPASGSAPTTGSSATLANQSSIAIENARPSTRSPS